MEKDLALIEQFLDALWLEKNLAENTLSAYRRDLTMLVEWLAHRGYPLRARSVTTCRRCLGNVSQGATKPPVPRVCLAPCVGCSSISTVRRFAKTIPARCWLPLSFRSGCQKISAKHKLKIITVTGC